MIQTSNLPATPLGNPITTFLGWTGAVNSTSSQDKVRAPYVYVSMNDVPRVHASNASAEFSSKTQSDMGGNELISLEKLGNCATFAETRHNARTERSVHDEPSEWRHVWQANGEVRPTKFVPKLMNRVSHRGVVVEELDGDRDDAIE